MEELLTAQQSTWEEKEKLSQQLEEERQNNVNAAIGQVRSSTDCYCCSYSVVLLSPGTLAAGYLMLDV